MSLDNELWRRRFGKGLTRRAALGAAAAAAVTPALAEECHLGPPAHDQGPSVWMNLDQIELDLVHVPPDQRALDVLRRADMALLRKRRGRCRRGHCSERRPPRQSEMPSRKFAINAHESHPLSQVRDRT